MPPTAPTTGRLGGRISGVTGEVVQICFVVFDLDKAVDDWTTLGGAGPFLVRRNREVPARMRSGEAALAKVHSALGQAGALQIELIESHGGHGNVYELSPSSAVPQFHHYAMYTSDIEQSVADFEAHGCPLWSKSDFRGAPIAYVDTRSIFGCFTELFQAGHGIERFFAEIAALGNAPAAPSAS